MGKFILLKKRPFKKIERQYGAKGNNSFLANIRRPYMGLQAPKRERHGTISVITAEGTKLDLLDLHALDGTRKTSTYSNFILQNYNRVENEKIQILETWGEEFAILYGRKPRIMQFQGVLVSAPNFPWESQFWFNYDNLLRGTRLAEEGARIFLEVDNMYVSGYMFNAQAQREEQVQQRVPFGFTMLVSNIGYYDIHEAASHVLSIGPSDSGSTKLPNYASKTNIGEYAQLTGPGGKGYERKEKQRVAKWRQRRKEIFDAEAPTLRNNPHLEAEVAGTLPFNSAPESYGEQLGDGFSGGEAPGGKGVRDQKRDGTYVDPYPESGGRSTEATEANELLAEMTTPYSATETRSMVGTKRERSERTIGMSAVSELLLEDSDPEEPETRTQQYSRELSESGSAFLLQTEAILNGTASPGSEFNSNQGRSVSQSTVITSTDQAWEVRNRAERTNRGHREPRAGVFYTA